MGIRLGNDRRLWVEGTTPGTYNMIKGNQALTINRSGGSSDGTSKDDYPYNINIPANRNLSLNASFIPNYPDATGFERLVSLARGATVSAVQVQIRKGGATGASPADVEFECSMYVTDDSTDASQNKVVDNSFTLVPAAAPTVDVLK